MEARDITSESVVKRRKAKKRTQEKKLTFSLSNESSDCSLSQKYVSKKYKSEKELHDECMNKLKRNQVRCIRNDKKKTGIEIDILARNYCFEVKCGSETSKIFTAIGQLKVNNHISGLRMGLILPSDVEIRKDIKNYLYEMDIEVFDEKTILKAFKKKQ